MSAKRIIGTDSLSYPQRRNFAGLPFTRYEVRKLRDLYSLPNFLYFKLTGRSQQRWLNSHRDFGLRRVHGWHFFNTLSEGRRPWVTTFETSLPRWGAVSRGKMEYGLRLMAGKACHKMIAISQSAYDIQMALLFSEYPAYRDEITAKMCVIHPAQAPLIAEYGEKDLDPDHIHFLLVGNQIFSKGGREALAAAGRLHREGFSLRLHIVSGLSPDNYATRTGPEDVRSFRAEMEISAPFLQFHGRLPNDEVLRLWKRAHVALMPTYADSYGYSVLEAQACGCPVISTDIRALPEINGPDRGWLIPLEKIPSGNARLHSPADREAASERISQGLYSTMKEICDNPAQIRIKGEAALKNIRAAHDPQDRVRQIEAIYDGMG